MDRQYDKLFSFAPRGLDNPAGRKKRAMIEQEELRRLAQRPDRPANMGVFQDALIGVDAGDERPRVGYFCHIVPDEMITALRARPVRLDCGNVAAITDGEDVLAGDVCPLAKASLGAFRDRQGGGLSCRCLVLAATCDAKRKLGEILSDYLPVFTLALPAEQNSRLYAHPVQKELERMVAFLQAALGTRLTTSNLRRAVELSCRRSALVRRLQALRVENPTLLSIGDLFLIVQSSFAGMPPERWLAEADRVAAELESRACSIRKPQRPRIVLTGAPVLWPNFKPLTVIEESGADVVADTLCSGAQSGVDPVVADEWGRSGLMRAIALKHVFASICPCFISQTTRINRVLELVEATGADGVINHGLRLCQLFDVENYRLEQVLKGRKIPYLNLRTDYSREDIEQLRVRVEAFLETME